MFGCCVVLDGEEFFGCVIRPTYERSAMLGCYVILDGEQFFGCRWMQEIAWSFNLGRQGVNEEKEFREDKQEGKEQKLILSSFFFDFSCHGHLSKPLLPCLSLERGYVTTFINKFPMLNNIARCSLIIDNQSSGFFFVNCLVALVSRDFLPKTGRQPDDGKNIPGKIKIKWQMVGYSRLSSIF